MKLQILSAIVAISATGAAATALNCGEVQTIYQDATCCDNSAAETCARKLEISTDFELTDGVLTLKNTVEYGTVAGTALEGNTALLQLGDSATTALAGNTLTITSAQATSISATSTWGISKDGSNNLKFQPNGQIYSNKFHNVGSGMDVYSGLKVRSGGLQVLVDGATIAGGLSVTADGATVAGGLEVTGSVGTATSLSATHLLYVPGTSTTNYGGGDTPHWWGTSQMGANFYNAAKGMIGISVDEGIVANNYFYNSDRRIKRDIVDADTGELLAKLNQLSMRKYGYITQGEDSETTVGWIAQEVADVDATYVNKVTKSIPDIGGIAVITTTGDGATTVRLPGVAIEVGEKLQVNSATGGAITVTVTSVAADDLVTFDREIAEEESESGIDENGDEVARVIQIYGRVVDDFHTLDKGRLLATAVGAIQELSTRLEALEVRLAALE